MTEKTVSRFERKLYCLAKIKRRRNDAVRKGRRPGQRNRGTQGEFSVLMSSIYLAFPSRFGANGSPRHIEM